MDIKLKYREVFNDLYRSEKGLMAFTLYSRYNIPPSEAVEFINYYENLEIISIDGEQRIKLTSKGKNEILGILNKIGISNISTNSSYLTMIKSDENINLFEPYLPDRRFYDNFIKERSEKETSK